MEINNNHEAQGYTSEFIITLLSGEVIKLPHIQEEYINEEHDGYIRIDIESATYNQRLYEAFKNKELVQNIVRKSVHRNIIDASDINREFTYKSYFKIDKFSVSSRNDSCATYSIIFQSV